MRKTTPIFFRLMNGEAEKVEEWKKKNPKISYREVFLRGFDEILRDCNGKSNRS